jgi:hypothetical protein
MGSRFLVSNGLAPAAEAGTAFQSKHGIQETMKESIIKEKTEN